MMTRRKPSNYFEERFTTALLPQEYTFRKLYKTVQRSEFHTEHEWQANVTIEYSLGLFANSIATFQTTNSLTCRGNYTTTKEESKEEETEFIFPIKIPPYTSSCLTATIWEEHLDIPYKSVETVYDQFNRVIIKRNTQGIWNGVACYVADVHVQENFRREFWLMVIVVILIIVKFIWV